jgi:sarcosine oxidase
LGGVSRPRIAVIGLGAVGSAAALHLARAGAAVIGFDRWRPPHRFGSTHGESRITRATAWEGARYVPLVARAQRLWADFARETGGDYFAATGGLFVGHPHDYHLAGSLGSAEAQKLDFAWLSAREITQRWPWLRVPDGMAGFFDPAAGVLAPERIVADQLRAAEAAGATLRFDTVVHGYSTTASGVTVESEAGRDDVDGLVLCSGGWTAELTGWTGPAMPVERVTQHWFAERTDAPARGAAPVLLLGDGQGHATAVFPTREGRIKVAGHGSGQIGPLAELARELRPDDVTGAEGILRAYLPAHAGAHLESSSCFYTRTACGHFVIDRVRGAPQVVFASACNGYGFKFSVAVGEALAALALGEEPPVDIRPWRLGYC